MSEIILLDVGAHTGAAPATLRFATQGYVSPAPRTNLIRYSEQLNDAVWTKTRATVTANSVAAPDGTTTADTLIETAVASTHAIYPSSVYALGTQYTLSIYAKLGPGSRFVQLGFNSTAFGGSTSTNQAVFNLSTGAQTKGAGLTSSTIKALANGWYRLSVTRTATVNITTSSGSLIYLRNAYTIDTATGYTGDGTSGVYLWGGQLEVGPIATPYIQTVAAAVTTPTAGLENLYYEPRIKQPGNIQRTIFSDGRTFGASRVGFGEVVLVNNDGALDYLLPYGFAGFPITITRGTMSPNQSAPTWSTVLTGTMDSVDFSWAEVSIKVRDRQQELAKPIQSANYGGTNVLPAGLDGVATDIKGNGEPILFGRVYNITPPQVNTTRIIYQISDALIQSVDAVYDRGTALTAGAAYSSQADMETNAPSAGQYRAWLNAAGSYVRLGSQPAGTLTVDATQGAAIANRTPAQLMNAALLKAGIVAGDITAADVTALDAAAAYDCGFWVSGSETGVETLDAFANSIGAWWGVDRLGKFRMGQIIAPLVGNSIGTLDAVDMISVDRVRSNDQGGGVPAWQVKLNYARMFTTQDDLAAAVPGSLKSDRAEEWRTVIANDAAVKTQWPKAVEIVFDTHLISAADAAAEAARRLAIYKVRRDTLQVRAKLDATLAAAIDLGKTVVVQLPRFGMDAGKPFLVTGIRTDLRNNIFDLTLWG